MSRLPRPNLSRHITLLSLLLLLQLSHPIFADLVGQNVQCDPSQMHVFFDFDEPFHGVIYAKEAFGRPGCQIIGDGSNKASISFPLNIDASKNSFCGVRLAPSAHVFDVVVRVNADRDILVQGMKEFQVRCQYRLDPVTLQLPSVGGLLIQDNSPNQNNDEIPQAVIQGSGSGIVPILDMTMRQGAGITGKPVQTAAIGEEITMDVYLHDPVPYDIFVYNCIAHEGSRLPGGTITLIDSNGCGVELERVTTPPVEVTMDQDGIKHVHLRLRGFQFSTSETVFFECQVKPCLHQCNVTVTPSSSDPSHSRFRLSEARQWIEQCPAIRADEVPTPAPLRSEEFSLGKKFVAPEEQSSFSLQASLAMRFQDPEKEIGAPALLRLNPETKKAEVCLPQGAMAVLATIFIAVCLLCAAALTFLWHRLRRDLHKDVHCDRTISTIH